MNPCLDRMVFKHMLKVVNKYNNVTTVKVGIISFAQKLHINSNKYIGINLGGSQGARPLLIEKRPCIYQLFPLFSPEIFLASLRQLTST